MGTQTMGLGSQGSYGGAGRGTQESTYDSLAWQNSMYNFTLDEVQSQLDDYGATQNEQLASSSTLNGQSSVTISRDLTKKTVDEVMQDIQQGKKKTSTGINSRERNLTLGEISLEDFLVRAGVVAEGEKASVPVKGVTLMALPHHGVSQHATWMDYQIPSAHPTTQQQTLLTNFMQGNPVQPPLSMSSNPMVLDTAAQNNSNILGTENDNTMIPVVNKTCQEVHKPEREIKPQDEISFETLMEQFGKPLDDAAASFGVSRSTFKRRCRDHGIERWQYGKRTMGESSSSNLRRKLNDEEASRRNFSHSGMPSLQDTSQHLNKMTVKATYRGITIRFELPDLSAIAELEDNVIERLHLERRSFTIKYQDDEDDWILLACDKDVQECMKISRSSNKTTIKISIDPAINNHHTP